MNTRVKELMSKYNTNISKYATKDNEYIRLKNEEEDIRPPFFRDTDRIIYSLSYTKYLDKTQVFSFNDMDFISKRMTHVQLVSKIARTIGRALNLNEDLIEAIALGHDLGHAPLGHLGESFLDKICLREKIGRFNHNAQSVRNLMFVDNNGKGRNLCVQTLDGILCHNGEFVNQEYYPKKKSVEDFLNDYNSTYDEDFNPKTLVPMTLEGCVVRISDMIGYLGRDIEDAISMGIITLDEFPKDLLKTLGTDNREIVNTIVTDIIDNSFEKPYLKMSDNIFESIKNLKKFNYEKIYSKAYNEKEIKEYENMFNKLYEYYFNSLKEKNLKSSIFTNFLNYQNKDYSKEDEKRIVIDYIAGMTDDYFLREYCNLGEK